MQDEAFTILLVDSDVSNVKLTIRPTALCNNSEHLRLTP